MTNYTFRPPATTDIELADIKKNNNKANLKCFLKQSGRFELTKVENIIVEMKKKSLVDECVSIQLGKQTILIILNRDSLIQGIGQIDYQKEPEEQ